MPEKKVLARLTQTIGTLSERLVHGLSPEEREFKRFWPSINKIEGYLVPGQEKWLFRMARDLPDGATIVEIGSYLGRSTTCLAYGCLGTKKRVYAVDTFDGNESDFQGPGRRNFYDKWKSNIAKNGLQQYVTAIKGDSRSIGPTWSRPINLLFIDASHVYEDVLADFENFFPHLVKGGIVAFHDVGSHEGPTRLWEERKHLLGGCEYCSTIAYGTKE